MGTELLKTFLEVSQTRRFGRTAKSLYLAQSVVSLRIRQLESQLGVNLFTRHGDNIRLTAAGEKLLPYAETFISTRQAVRKEVAHTSQHNELFIGANASLWECMPNQRLGHLYQNRDVHTDLQFEARIAQRQPPVRQLHERQLDLLITTKAPKMDEFCSQLLGYFTLALYTSAPSKLKGDLNYLRLGQGPDFRQREAGLIGAGEVPILAASSAELAQQQIAILNGCTWLPISWAHKKGGPCTVADSTTPSRPLYAIWLRNSDKNALIRDLLKTNVLDEMY